MPIRLQVHGTLPPNNYYLTGSGISSYLHAIKKGKFQFLTPSKSKNTPYKVWRFADRAVHLSIFISVINQLDAQNVCFTISLGHASTCFEHMCLSSGGQNCITQPLVSSHYLKKLFIYLLRLCGVCLLYINCWIYRKCNFTVVKMFYQPSSCIFCRFNN